MNKLILTKKLMPQKAFHLKLSNLFKKILIEVSN